MITLSPIKRRLLYVSLFELLAIFLSTLLLMALSDSGAHESLPVAVIVSSVAVLWNYIYNTLCEAWESRARIMERTFKIRSIHTLGFETGLFLFCLPLYMLWYDVGVWVAMYMESALLLFFLVYTFVFTWMFDQIFTLPQQS